jgi:hypothetical protein
MANRVQANVAPLKVQGSIWPVSRMGRNLLTHAIRGVAVRMIAIPHMRCSAGWIDQRSRALGRTFDVPGRCWKAVSWPDLPSEPHGDLHSTEAGDIAFNCVA